MSEACPYVFGSLPCAKVAGHEGEHAGPPATWERRAAGSPPPTPAPTREQVAAVIEAKIWALAEQDDLGRQSVADMAATITDAVMALLPAEPAPSLWTGDTRAYMTGLVDGPELSWISPELTVPPGTAVEVRPASPSAVTPPTDPRPALYDALTRIVGDIGPINDESSRRTAAHMLRHYGAEVREKRP